METDKSYIYNNKRKFKSSLDRLWKVCGYDQKEIEKDIEHEEAHFNKAIELGYFPLYILNINKTSLFKKTLIIKLKAFTLVPRRNRSLEDFQEDMIQVCLAPSIPGEEDLALANKYREHLKK